MLNFEWNADKPPFSFRLDGRPADVPAMRCDVRECARVTRACWTDAASGIEVAAEVRRFADFPAVDWVLTLTNRGAADSLILSDILPFDLALDLPAKERAYLHYAKGSRCEIDDFLPQTATLGPKSAVTLAPVGGRSSNGVLPFMNVHHRDGGFILAVGWSGQWQASFTREGGALRVTAGMQKTRLRLHPGESIRTPRILVIPYAGDPEDGTNALRRMLLEHYLPRIDGKLVGPPVAQCLQFYYYLTGKAGEDLELAVLPKAAALGATAYWIDACWYGQGREWWQEVGNWAYNRRRYPNGLRPIADAAHARGMKFILWFEPARVRKDGDVAREHPDFVLSSPHDADNRLLDFGNPKARAHILDLFSGILEESAVDVYREDFNFDPLPYWQASDAPDRVGMTEIRYIEGHYAFWDELRRRFPKMSIDNCASGGRRIDLETLSRSIPLWSSDFNDVGGLTWGMGLHVGDQCVKAGLARWVPLLGGGVWNFTPYATRSALIGGFTFGCHIDHADFPEDRPADAPHPNDVMVKGKTLLSPDFPFDAARAAIAEWKSLREFFLGDFYLLLPLTVSYHDWCAWQFHRADRNAGFAVFLRRHRSPFPTMQVRLKAIDPNGHYEVGLASGYEDQTQRRMTGRELADITVTISGMPGSMLLRYARTE